MSRKGHFEGERAIQHTGEGNKRLAGLTERGGEVNGVGAVIQRTG